MSITLPHLDTQLKKNCQTFHSMFGFKYLVILFMPSLSNSSQIEKLNVSDKSNFATSTTKV